MSGRFGLLGLFSILLLVLVVGGIGYAIGASTTSVAVVPGSVAYPVGYAHFGWGFPLFGILFFFLFLGLIFAALRPRRWAGGPGWGGRGWYGPRSGGAGAWGPPPTTNPDDPRFREWLDTSVPPAMQATFEAWHRQMHEGEAAVGSKPGSSGPSGPTTGPAR